MFSTEVRSSRFSPIFFILQLFLAPLGSLICGLVIAGLLENLFGVRNNNFVSYSSFVLEGFILGYATQTAYPRAQQSGGLWVWIPPVCMAIYAVIEQFERNPGKLIGNYFLFRSGSGIEGMGIVFVTLPAISSCFYSVGILIASRPAKTRLGAAVRNSITARSSS